MHAAKYDGTLQMLVEEPRELDYKHLGFLRWLTAQTSVLDDDIADKTEEVISYFVHSRDDFWVDWVQTHESA